MSAAKRMEAMIELRTLLLVSPLSLLLACGNTCEAPETTSDAASGTYTYTAPDPPSAGSYSLQGTIDSSDRPSISVNPSSSLGVQGAFPDVEGHVHMFTLVAEGLSSGVTSALTNESQLCDEQDHCIALAGSVSVTTFSQDCRTEGCASNLSGTLHAAGGSGGESVVIDLTIDLQQDWQSVSCPQSSAQGGFEGS